MHTHLNSYILLAIWPQRDILVLFYFILFCIYFILSYFDVRCPQHFCILVLIFCELYIFIIQHYAQLCVFKCAL